MPIPRMNRRMEEIRSMLGEMERNKSAFNKLEFSREQLRFCYDCSVGKGTTEFYGMVESLIGSGILRKSEGVYSINKTNFSQLINEMKKSEAVE